MIEGHSINNNPFLDFLSELPLTDGPAGESKVNNEILASMDVTYIGKNVAYQGRQYDRLALPIPKEDAHKYDNSVV